MPIKLLLCELHSNYHACIFEPTSPLCCMMTESFRYILCLFQTYTEWKWRTMMFYVDPQEMKKLIKESLPTGLCE